MKFPRKADEKNLPKISKSFIKFNQPVSPGASFFFVFFGSVWAVVVLRLEIKIQNIKHSASVITYTQRLPSVL